MDRLAKNINLIAGYLPQRIKSDLHFFKAEDGTDGEGTVVNVEPWRACTAGVLHEIVVPGNHVTLLKQPHVKIVAHRLASLLCSTKSEVLVD